MKIKVCGLRDPANIAEVAALQPDHVGFICYDLSPRFIADMPADTLNELPSSISKTGVFVNTDADTIHKMINKYHFDVIQLNGDESPEFANSFRDKVTVIKAFGLNRDFDFDQLNVYTNKVDYFLFDTKTD